VGVVDVVRRFQRAVKRCVPEFILDARRHRILKRSIERVDRDLVGRPASEVFSEIYRRQLWGRPVIGRRFSSGHGSYVSLHVDSYVAAMDRFIRGLSWTPSVVDLGCGDFNVGSKIRYLFGRYVAVDIAQEVLVENRNRYSEYDVDFVGLDVIRDEFPDADICIIRQVLQHLSNDDISQIVTRLGKYKVVILTEPLPRSDFIPNLDQPTGVSSRLARGIQSGVVITAPPFSLGVQSSQVICSTFDDFSKADLVTTAHWLVER